MLHTKALDRFSSLQDHPIRKMSILAGTVIETLMGKVYRTIVLQEIIR